MIHDGNVFFRHMLESNYEEYDKAPSKREKTEIAWSIVRQLENCSCRFLKEDPRGYWVQVSSEVARQKVSVGFRDLRKTFDTDAISSPKKVSVKRKGNDFNSSTSIFLGMDGGGMKRQRCGFWVQGEEQPKSLNESASN